MAQFTTSGCLHMRGITESLKATHLTIVHQKYIQLMKQFLRESHLYSTLPCMPDEFKEDFGDLLSLQFEPHLVGSLQATVHSTQDNRFDPRIVDKWQLTTLGTAAELTLPSSYVRSSFSESVELWWKDLFEEDLDLFIPVQLIICHTVVSEVMHEGQTVYLTVPV